MTVKTIPGIIGHIRLALEAHIAERVPIVEGDRDIVEVLAYVRTMIRAIAP